MVDISAPFAQAVYSHCGQRPLVVLHAWCTVSCLYHVFSCLTLVLVCGIAQAPSTCYDYPSFIYLSPSFFFCFLTLSSLHPFLFLSDAHTGSAPMLQLAGASFPHPGAPSHETKSKFWYCEADRERNRESWLNRVHEPPTFNLVSSSPSPLFCIVLRARSLIYTVLQWGKVQRHVLICMMRRKIR